MWSVYVYSNHLFHILRNLFGTDAVPWCRLASTGTCLPVDAPGTRERLVDGQFTRVAVAGAASVTDSWRSEAANARFQTGVRVTPPPG